MRHLLKALCLVPFITGCDFHLHPHEDFLKESVGRVEHDAVAKKLGAPNRVVALDKGGDLWTYEFCRTGPITTCENLNLVFDKQGTLAEWQWQDK